MSGKDGHRPWMCPSHIDAGGHVERPESARNAPTPRCLHSRLPMSSLRLAEAERDGSNLVAGEALVYPEKPEWAAY